MQNLGSGREVEVGSELAEKYLREGEELIDRALYMHVKSCINRLRKSLRP